MTSNPSAKTIKNPQKSRKYLKKNKRDLKNVWEI